MESVQCGDCGHRYDSDENAFCPRCGALEKMADPADAVRLAGAQDPRRRPIQAAGVMMTALGALSVALFVATMILAPTLVPANMDEFADMEGGQLRVLFSDGDEPVAGANLTVTTVHGEPLANGTTDANGTWSYASDFAVVNLTIAADGGIWQRQILSLSGATADVELDTADDQASTWVGLDEIVQATRVLTVVFAVIALITVIGGIAAIRLRGRQWAMAGAGVALLPALILSMVSLLFVVFPILFGGAIILFVRGRPLFAS